MKYVLLSFVVSLLFPLSAFAETPVAVKPAESVEIKKAENSLYAYETTDKIKIGAVMGVLPNIDADDELVSLSSPVCDRVEIHEMKEVSGVMQMRQVPFYAMKAGQDNTLSPMSYHLMLIGLKSALKAGDTFPLTLNFKTKKPETVTVSIRSRKDMHAN